MQSILNKNSTEEVVSSLYLSNRESQLDSGRGGHIKGTKTGRINARNCNISNRPKKAY